MLTAGRSGEVRGAAWTEIDLANRVWTIPAARMKANREHRVPLCGRALEILEAARTLGNGSGPLVFPTARGSQLRDMALSGLPKNLKVAAVPPRMTRARGCGLCVDDVLVEVRRRR